MYFLNTRAMVSTPQSYFKTFLNDIVLITILKKFTVKPKISKVKIIKFKYFKQFSILYLYLALSKQILVSILEMVISLGRLTLLFHLNIKELTDCLRIGFSFSYCVLLHM